MSPPAAYTNIIQNTKCSAYNGYKMDTTYIRGMSKINANILGI